ncbi:MAG: hypothetical protein OFPI_08900 [Osedax symbiont Rs2]|nr:MAG: hypothetical protein OFPI_08900 [Osedax symbiont Rs2]
MKLGLSLLLLYKLASVVIKVLQNKTEGCLIAAFFFGQNI